MSLSSPRAYANRSLPLPGNQRLARSAPLTTPRPAMTSVSRLGDPGVGRTPRNWAVCGRFRYQGSLGHGGADGVLLGQVNDKTLSELGWSTLYVALAETLSELEPLAVELERAFDPAGKLLDTAGPLLAELRERARGLHRAIKARLEAMLLDENVAAMLRETYYSVRGDRYVLPVRAEHKSHLPGIVHNASGSGQTLFIEPQELLELGNQLTIAESSALEEEQRILGELSQAVGTRAPALERDVATLAVLDEAGAAARLAHDLGPPAPPLTDPSAAGAAGSFALR